MSDSREPKKETVRIPLPGAPSGEQASDDAAAENQADVNAQPMQPSPIENLSAGPVRPPTFRPPPSPPATSPQSPTEPAKATLASGAAEPATAASSPTMPPRPRVLPPPPRVAPALSASDSALAKAPANFLGSAAPAVPKKETARIVLPEKSPRPAPAVKMTKTQPLMRAPAAKIQSAPVTVAARGSGSIASGVDTIPLPICWAIFGISAIALLIQIWNYLAS